MALNKIIPIILIIAAALFVRFYNYENRIAYNAEQGIALTTAADYINKKFTFLGQRTFFRTTSDGHILYSGALYNYSMVPLLLIFRYDPLPITVIYTLLNVATGLIFYFLISKQFNHKLGFFTLILFLFNDDMIARSLYFWILHTMPLISILTIYLSVAFYRKQKAFYSLYLGILSGIAFGLEYFYSFTALAIFLFLLKFSNEKIKICSLYVVGALVGNFTMVVFDLRNNFYYTRTLWDYFLDTLHSKQNNVMYQYHFLNLWPIGILILAYLIYVVAKKNKYLAFASIAIYIVLNLVSPKISFKESEMHDVKYKTIVAAAKAIAEDNPSNFNIVDMPHLDFRAYRLRFLVEYKYKKPPQDVESYQNIDTLYVFNKGTLDLSKGQPWEITAFGGRKQSTVAKLADNFYVYKITK